ncbi:hypothetical protein BHM03_00002123 [Ensete ventricosum]|nr:hypothetical protein BHM03_00002123 [Ensete ventricosum]
MSRERMPTNPLNECSSMEASHHHFCSGGTTTIIFTCGYVHLDTDINEVLTNSSWKIFPARHIRPTPLEAHKESTSCRSYPAAPTSSATDTLDTLLKDFLQFVFFG